MSVSEKSLAKSKLGDDDAKSQKSAKPTPKTLCNPCGCWSLKDGCIVIGIWTVICAMLQLALFGWQMSVVREERYRSANSRAAWYGSLRRTDRRYPAYYEQYYETPEERFYLQLFIVQIVHLISDGFLLGAGIAVIWGVQRRVRYAFWPYYVTVILNILANLAFSGIWLSSPSSPSLASAKSTSYSVRDRIPYWGVLVAVALIFALVNIYGFVVILAGHRHVRAGLLKVRGYVLEPRPPPARPPAHAVSVYHDDNAPGTTPPIETKVLPEDLRREMTTGLGSLRQPMDPNLLAFQQGYPQQGYSPFQPAPTGPSPYPYYAQGTMGPPRLDPTPVPPYRPIIPASGDAKQQFTELWLNGVEPGAVPMDPAPVYVGPPTQSVLDGSKERRRSRRRRHGSRSSMRSRGSRSSARRAKSRGSESDTSSSSAGDFETKSRTSRTSRTSNRTCDSCRRKLKYGDDDGRKHRHRSGSRKRHSSDDSRSSDTGYSDFTRSRTTGKQRRSGSDSESMATSYITASRITADSGSRRSGRSRRSQSDDERRSNRRRSSGRGQRSSPRDAAGSGYAKPSDGVGGDPAGYTSAPAGVNEAGSRHPIRGSPGGGATITIPLVIPASALAGTPQPPGTPKNRSQGSGTPTDLGSFSEGSTLPMGAAVNRRTPEGKSGNTSGGSGAQQANRGSGGGYQLDSEITIQYNPKDGMVVTSGGGTSNPSTSGASATPHPASPIRSAVTNRPAGGVALPGMTNAPPLRPTGVAAPGGPSPIRPPAPGPIRPPGGPNSSGRVEQTLNNSSSSSNTRTYGTTAV